MSDVIAPAAPAVEPEPKPNSFARIVGVIVNPDATFASIARRPHWVVPLVLWLLLSMLSGIVIAQKVDFGAAAREAMEQKNSGNMSPEQMDRGVKMAASIGKVFAYTAPLWGALIFVIIAAVLLLAFRLFGGEGTFVQSFSATLYAWVPNIISGCIALIILLVKGAITANDMRTLVRSNLGFLVDLKTNPMAFALLSSLDIFTIWALVLFIIAFAYVGRVSKGKSAAIVISLWVVTVLFKLVPAAMAAAQLRK
jgi:hypothetical protein